MIFGMYVYYHKMVCHHDLQVTLTLDLKVKSLNFGSILVSSL